MKHSGKRAHVVVLCLIWPAAYMALSPGHDAGALPAVRQVLLDPEASAIVHRQFPLCDDHETVREWREIAHEVQVQGGAVPWSVATEEGMSVRGVVRDTWGNALGSFPVAVLTENAGQGMVGVVGWETITNLDGSFCVRLQSPGRFFIQAGTVVWQAGPRVFAAVPSAASGLTDVLAERTSSARVVFAPAFGEFEAEFMVGLAMEGRPRAKRRVAVGADGVVDMDGLMSGTWLVTARTSAGCCEDYPVTLLPGPNDVVVRLVRVPGRAI